MCDLPSLLALRLTSSYLGKHVHSVLQSDLAALLRHYVDVPDALLGHMSTTGALIGGLAALSFLLRDRSMRPPSLDIFVALQEAEYLEILLGRDVTRGMQLVSTVDYDALNPDNTPPPNLPRGYLSLRIRSTPDHPQVHIAIGTRSHRSLPDHCPHQLGISPRLRLRVSRTITQPTSDCFPRTTGVSRKRSCICSPGQPRIRYATISLVLVSV